MSRDLQPLRDGVPIELEPGGDADDGESAILDCLGDAVSRDILVASAAESKPAPALVEACGVSRSTVYRRLNRLVDRGLVVEHHWTDRSSRAGSNAFRTVPDHLRIGITPEGFTVRGFGRAEPDPAELPAISDVDAELVEGEGGPHVDVTFRVPMWRMEQLYGTLDGLDSRAWP